jgi:molecular chaperone DnaK (HSP70)
MISHSYVVGIDLGTSNCALASQDLDSDRILPFLIPQFYDQDQIVKKSVLPSFMSLEGVVGEWAKRQASFQDDHSAIIHSAKSWLSHPYVDRMGPILPWNGEKRISPVEASKAYLIHLKDSFLKDKDLADLKQIVVTVPASFDDTARTLTLKACEEAGLSRVTLLEEPLAAFYAWVGKNAKTWRDQVSLGDVVCVCDIGGGTTDFSLFLIGEDTRGLLSVERLAVGPHLLLGGDNMDLALAQILEETLETPLDGYQRASLIHSVRDAKEDLLSHSEKDSVSFSIGKKGSKLFGKTVTVTLTQDMLREILLEGFFPVSPDLETPPPMGLGEFGLPYEQDPAVTAHLLRFLDGKIPQKILFNGGVFESSLLRERVLDCLRGRAPVEELIGESRDLAVAFGATYFGHLLEKGEGIRVQAGSPRTYYLGVESSGLAIPGRKPTVKGLCLLPQGTGEGTRLSLKEKIFFLTTGKTSSFTLFASRKRPDDRLGDLINKDEAGLELVAHLDVLLPPVSGDGVVPVYVSMEYTHVGVLQVFLNHLKTEERWALEFTLR